VRKSEEKGPLGRLRYWQDDNINMDLREIRECCGLDWSGSRYGLVEEILE
jgi:hypothetical protein